MPSEPPLSAPPDPYRAIHKALRVALGDLIACAGRTDFGEAASVARCHVELEAVVAMLATHARVEVQFIDPLLGAHDHARARAIQHDHTTLERQLHAVTAAFDDVEDCLAAGDASEARARGHAFYLALTRYTAAYFQHLADEEEEALPVLRERVDAAALAAAMAQARASVAPAEAAKVTARMLAAMSHPERVAFLRAAPSEAVRTIARVALDEAEWKALDADAG
jgi:hypothetical protein